MSKTKKTQSPVRPAAKKTVNKTAKKAAPRKPAKPKAAAGMEKPAPDAMPDMSQFAALWQQKWTEMLQEKGWPEQATMPSMGQLPFLMPFMAPNMGHMTQNGTNDATIIQNLQQRVAQLEYRIMELEKQSSKTKRKPRTS